MKEVNFSAFYGVVSNQCNKSNSNGFEYFERSLYATMCFIM